MPPGIVAITEGARRTCAMGSAEAAGATNAMGSAVLARGGRPPQPPAGAGSTAGATNAVGARTGGELPRKVTWATRSAPGDGSARAATTGRHEYLPQHQAAALGGDAAERPKTRLAQEW